MNARTSIRHDPPQPRREPTAPIPLRPAEQRPATTLEDVYAAIGPDLLTVVLAPGGLRGEVSGARVLDLNDDRPLAPRELVLGVALDGRGSASLRTLEAIGSARGAGLVLRSPVAPSPELVDEAARLGVALLLAAAGLEWGVLHTLVAAATRCSPRDGEVADALDADDLSSLADTTAALVGGPITIEDAQLRVLAFSGFEREQLDEQRVASVLARRTPERLAKQMRANGTVGRLAASDDVVAFAGEGMCPRRAIGIRAGGLVVGYIWAAQGASPLSVHADAALREAARLAAPLLLRRRAVTDLERNVRADLLRSLLQGRGAADALARDLGLARGGRYVVVAYQPACDDDPRTAHAEGRAVDLIAMFFRSYRREACVVAGEDGRLAALLRCAEEQSREALVAVVRESLASLHQALKLRLRAGLGTPVDAADSIVVSCREAEQALRVGGDGAHGSVVDIEDVRGESFVIELAEHVAANPCPLAKPLVRLYEHDRVNGTDYVETLTVYLDCFGNTALAAERLHIHPNTLRYRVRRLTELAEVDLEQAGQRFAVEAQLRLPALASAARHSLDVRDDAWTDVPRSVEAPDRLGRP